MNVRVAVDTNILAYAEGVDPDARQLSAQLLLKRLPEADTIIPVQVLGELYNVLARKAGWSRSQAQSAIEGWRAAYTTAETSLHAMMVAIDLATVHRLRIWDAVILAVAADAGCRLLLSEDMHDGFDWNGVTVANPFVASPHPLLQAFLR